MKEPKLAQEIQDEIFKKMSVEKNQIGFGFFHILPKTQKRKFLWRQKIC